MPFTMGLRMGLTVRLTKRPSDEYERWGDRDISKSFKSGCRISGEPLISILSSKIEMVIGVSLICLDG